MTKHDVKHVAMINGTPVVPVIAEGMVESGRYGIHEVVIHWEHEALYIENRGGGVVAVMSFAHQKHDGQTWIYMAFVRPEYRGRGMYRALWDAVVAQARDAGMRQVAGGVHPDNERMAGVAAAVGRRQLYTCWGVDIADD